jgi:hypothetical protein
LIVTGIGWIVAGPNFALFTAIEPHRGPCHASMRPRLRRLPR